MGNFYEEIKPEQKAWIEKQKMFVVASAPLTAKGNINASPKGRDSLRVLNSNKVCYLEMTGSGIETVSHIHENGRLTIMLMAFEGAPKIVRLFGRGHVLKAGTPEFKIMFEEHYLGSDLEPIQQGARSIIVMDVHKVGVSCGFGVPLYEFSGQRNNMEKYWGNKSKEQVDEYVKLKNIRSIDGLPGYSSGPKSSFSHWVTACAANLPSAVTVSMAMAVAFGAGVAATTMAIKAK
ncbi:hypothetical protein BGW38_004626 [Lunasporangiospora selenospora]|uniref:Pyridoxamine 5'-phosphate oxidase N-terminal domain-containing protein n=1 Tax=Lunasporangiospora selenospora TaxID=979761 RepID=A0A9P6G227_9FUNG|nr:hypothetical protein BGW38_004626 [Lunasporangiospora selenospora]